MPLNRVAIVRILVRRASLVCALQRVLTVAANVRVMDLVT